MIKADKGEVIIKGTNVEITFELNMLLDSILEDAPEIVISTLCLRTDELTALTSNIDYTRLAICDHIVNSYLKLKENHKNE